MYIFTKRQAHTTLKIWLNINTKKKEEKKKDSTHRETLLSNA